MQPWVVCFDRERGLDLQVELTEPELPLCSFFCMSRIRPRNRSIEACWFSSPSTVNHTPTAVRLCEVIAHQARQMCFRLGTLTYPLSFEVGVKVTVWRGRDRMVFAVP